VLAVLEALGFGPIEWDAERPEVHLHPCPYMGLMKKHPDAMCGLHAGIIRGILHRVGAADDAACWIRSPRPGACVVRVPASTR
jgi:predicted ArsR family transcriptional regulator